MSAGMEMGKNTDISNVFFDLSTADFFLKSSCSIEGLPALPQGAVTHGTEGEGGV